MSFLTSLLKVCENCHKSRLGFSHFLRAQFELTHDTERNTEVTSVLFMFLLGIMRLATDLLLRSAHLKTNIKGIKPIFNHAEQLFMR